MEPEKSGNGLFDTVPRVIQSTQNIFQAVDGATKFNNRTRSLELVLINKTEHNLNFHEEHFNSGTWFQSPNPLNIPPRQVSIMFVANRQGSIMCGVTGGLEYKLENTGKSLYMGFNNPFLGCYKNFIALDTGKSAEWAYDKSENDKVKHVRSHGYLMTCTLRPPENCSYKKFEYTITKV